MTSSWNSRFFCLIWCVNYIRNISIWIDYQLEREPLSSTHTASVQHIDSTLEPHPFSNQNPSVQHRNPSVPPENPSVPPSQFNQPLSSTPKTPQLDTKTPSAPHRKFLSSKPRIPQFDTVGWLTRCVELRGVLNWGFLMLNRGVFGVELMCWTEGCVELSGTPFNRLSPHQNCLIRLIWMVNKTCDLMHFWILKSQ